jgi:hypothetical protein
MQRTALTTGVAFFAATFALYLLCLSTSGGEHGHGALPWNALLFYVFVMGPITCLGQILGQPGPEPSILIIFLAASLNAILGAILAGILAGIWRLFRRSFK